MGKYQLDDKGKAQVQRFHEKHSKGGINKKDRVASLREQFLNKNNKKWEFSLRIEDEILFWDFPWVGTDVSELLRSSMTNYWA